MARLYLTYGSVPELNPLSRYDRIRALHASGAAYAKTPASWWNEWLRAVLILGLPIAAGLIVLLVIKDAPIAGLAMAVLAMIGYRVWLHFHLAQLRPFIRVALQRPLPDNPDPAAERWQQKPWAAGVFFGAFMGGVSLLTDDRPWWVTLLLAAGVGVFFGIAMRFLRKGRWGSIEWTRW
jgi:hypothetical protein